MCKLAGEDIGENFGVAVWVGRKAIVSCYAVFVKNAEAAKRLKFGVMERGKAEGVVSVQPSMIGMATLAGTTGDDFCV